jgi:hypothetical protein
MAVGKAAATVSPRMECLSAFSAAICSAQPAQHQYEGVDVLEENPDV